MSVDAAGSDTCERRRSDRRTCCNNWPALSGDGRYVAFESKAPDVVLGDTNRRSDIFVRGPL